MSGVLVNDPGAVRSNAILLYVSMAVLGLDQFVKISAFHNFPQLYFFKHGRPSKPRFWSCYSFFVEVAVLVSFGIFGDIVTGDIAAMLRMLRLLNLHTQESPSLL